MQSLMSCSMQRHREFAVSIFQTHSRGASGRQYEVDCTLHNGLFVLQSPLDAHVRPPQGSGVVGGGSVPPLQLASSKKQAASGKRVKKRSQVNVDRGVTMCVVTTSYSMSRAQRNPR